MNRHSSYSAPRSERPSGSYGGQRGRSNKRNTYNKRSWKDNRTLFNLVCFILPFIILNLIILFLAVSTPKIEYTVSDTQDYKTVELSVKIRSLLPIKEMTVSLGTQPLEMVKEKGVYKATLENNGTLEIYVTGWNGMSNRIYDHVATLDDAPPTINEEDYVMEGGRLTINVGDSQSGVNFDTAYATDENDQTVKPVNVTKNTGSTGTTGTSGTITFPMDTASLTVYIEDYAGNTFKASFTSHTEGIDTSSRDNDFSSDDSGSSSSGSASKSGSTTKETTKAAKETTKAAKETTKAAKETTKAAKETTKAAKETTKAAKETTKAAKETTKAAKETTKAPETTAANTLSPSPTQATNAPAGPGGDTAPTQSPSPSPTQGSQPASPTSGASDIVVVPVG